MTDSTKSVGGRPRSGQLIWRKSGWVARLTVILDGERVRVCRPLGTENKAVARRKLATLLESEDPVAADSRPAETFEEAARHIVAKQAKEGLASWKDRIRRLNQCAFPEFGAVAVTEIKPGHIRQALDQALERGWLRQSIVHLKNDISSILAELWRDEVIGENPALRVRVPKSAKIDSRTRVILNEAEFERFMACQEVSPELAVMALVSRTFGGMRTSDLHAWDWLHIDRETWADAHVPRPKTKSSDRLTLRAILVPMLQAWCVFRPRATRGACFDEGRIRCRAAACAAPCSFVRLT